MFIEIEIDKSFNSFACENPSLNSKSGDNMTTCTGILTAFWIGYEIVENLALEKTYKLSIVKANVKFVKFKSKTPIIGLKGEFGSGKQQQIVVNLTALKNISISNGLINLYLDDQNTEFDSNGAISDNPGIRIAVNMTDSFICDDRVKQYVKRFREMSTTVNILLEKPKYLKVYVDIMLVAFEELKLNECYEIPKQKFQERLKNLDGWFQEYKSMIDEKADKKKLRQIFAKLLTRKPLKEVLIKSEEKFSKFLNNSPQERQLLIEEDENQQFLLQYSKFLCPSK